MAADALDVVGTGLQIGSDIGGVGETVFTGGAALAGPAEATVIEGNGAGVALHELASGMRAADNGVGPGAHAGESIPAGPGPRPTAAQQGEINKIGQDTGCHTCGTKDPGTKSGNFVGDHQPPTKINPPGNPQRYYPQCKGCSNIQGGKVRQMPPAPPPPPPASQSSIIARLDIFHDKY